MLTEVASLLALLATTGDDRSAGEERLSQQLETAKRALLRQSEATRDPRWLVVLCHVVEQFASRLVHQTAQPLAAAAGSERASNPQTTGEQAQWTRSMFLLENAVATALQTLERLNQHTVHDASSAMDVDTGRIRRIQHQQSSADAKVPVLPLSDSYRRLLGGVLLVFSDDNERGRSAAAAVLSRIALLLAICWLTTTPTHSHSHSVLSQAMELLTAAAEGCERHRESQSSACGPLFLLGMLQLVEKRDYEQALQCFRRAAVARNASNSSNSVGAEGDGAFHYWYGVALFKNGCTREATAQLQWCLRSDYEAVASLNLSALAHVRGNGKSDAYSASLDLQRALEIDFLAPVTMFNYAALLGAMRSFAAQQQMLAYYQEAVHPEGSVAVERKRARSGTPKARRRGENCDLMAASCSMELFTESQLAALFAPNGSYVTPAMVSSQLAYAAMENSDWELSKQCFEELLAAEGATGTRAEVHHDYIYVLLQSNLYTLALDTCDRVIASLKDDPEQDDADASLLVLLYKADALLSLERVRECQQFLKVTVEPKILQLLPSSQPHRKQRSARNKTELTSSSSEVSACHAQLINNLAVVTACQDDDNTNGGSGGVSAGIAMLREGIQLYPSNLSLKFNLVLLLWRKAQKEAACSIWFEARGWSLAMDTRDIGDEQKAVELVASAEEAAILAAARPHPQISEHVRSSADDNEGVTSQQLLFLDALVLNHWGKIQSSRAIETSVNYIQYLDGLSAQQ